MTKTLRKNAAAYNDPKHNYLHYWDGRDYEHAAEELAISRLLRGKHFAHAVDVGGGYGRLSKYLTKYADRVTLAEPSQQQHDLAKDYLKDTPRVAQALVQAADLPFGDGAVDLVLVVRVLHHLPDPTPEFTEIARVLQPGGTFLLEFANNAHFLNRLRYASKGKKVPAEPVSILSENNRKSETLPFVNHHPRTILKQLDKAGFSVEKVLSGSNLRSPGLKKILPKNAMIGLEKILQPFLAPTYFGPSTWVLLKKK